MRDLNMEQLRGAVRIYMAAKSLQDAKKELGGALMEKEPEALEQASNGLESLFNAIIDRCGDPDRQVMARNRAASLKVRIGYTDAPQPGKYLVNADDLSFLVDYMLNYCDMDCPCVVIDEGTGERSIIRQAVKGCAIRKLYKRLGVAEGMSPECPYSMYLVGGGKE